MIKLLIGMYHAHISIILFHKYSDTSKNLNQYFIQRYIDLFLFLRIHYIFLYSVRKYILISDFL